MRRRRRGPESGFTVLEVLVTASLAGVLSVLSLESFNLYRQGVYDAIAYDMIRTTRLALAAGQVQADDLGLDYFEAWTDNDGNLFGIRVEEFLPGLRASEDIRVGVNYDSLCDSADAILDDCAPGEQCCVVTWIEAYHCHGATTKSLTIWNNGDTIAAEWANAGC